MIDPKDYPADKFQMTLEDIQELNPHRHEFQQLDGVLYFNAETGEELEYAPGTVEEPAADN